MQNSDNFLYQYIYNAVSPMDMKGTVQLFSEYNDEREATSFIYTAALRRINRISAAARSEPWFGCDMAMDDDFLWSGKNNGFNWKLIGEKTVLGGFSSPDNILVENMLDGSIRRVSPQIEFGFDISDWQGAPWAPVSVIWSPRPVWIVESVPKDSAYNYGRQVFYIDKDTFGIWFKEVYDQSGEYWKAIFALQSFKVASDGRNNLPRPDLFMGIDEKEQHASYNIQLDSASGVDNAFYCPTSLVGPKSFTMGAVQELSK
jgi:hypothetical protein